MHEKHSTPMELSISMSLMGKPMLGTKLMLMIGAQAMYIGCNDTSVISDKFSKIKDPRYNRYILYMVSRFSGMRIAGCCSQC